MKLRHPNKTMRWNQENGYSQDVEDRRSQTAGGRGYGFRGGGLRIGLGGLLVLGVLSVIFRTDLITPFLGGSFATAPAPRVERNPARDAREEPLVRFVSFVLDDNQAVWEKIFVASGRSYQRAKLVLFRDVVESACGMAEAATGPFYCPGDNKAYIDLSFYEELKQRFGAPGDFAQAYVLAHEIGHHVQNLLGIERKMRAAQRQNPAAANQLSVRMELQADCLAGVWGHSAAQRNILEPGDVEEGLNAAAAIGDDRIQRMAGRRVSPESFTHGSSAQRVEWFQRGLRSGDLSQCNTFAGVW
ncbi:MAG: neutral zinc metallopeptidase [Bryobacteraceae bacterium]|nr:neutral zinc metallopeptidase [Bryobacteraceae bacterium]MDW8378391.1 neutral zinc metallopeptidase [Bryobacterales bacterium]